MTNSGSTRTIVQLFTKGCRMRGVERRTPPATVPGQPPAQGLYDPRDEHDACGVGFVVNIKGKKSHTIVRQALGVLINLLHRGACGCEPNTGDGAGILLQVPDKFLRKHCRRLGIALPGPKDYGVGCVFLPRDIVQREKVQGLIAGIVSEEGQRLLGWRDVPTDDRLLGASAVHVEPHIKQVFIGRGEARDSAHFERKLYVIRKRIEHAVEAMDFSEKRLTYIPSLSSNTLIYKGMLSADQIETMYPDLRDPDIESALALVHQRQRRLDVRDAQVGIHRLDLVGRQHALVDERVAAQARDVGQPLPGEVHRLDGVLDALADDVELALEVRGVARLAAADEHLLDVRLDVDGAGAQQPVVGRHVAPAEQALAFLADDAGDEPLDLLALHDIARQEHAADPVVLRAGQGDAEAAAVLAEEFVGDLQENAGAVAGVRLAATGAAVQEVDQHEEALADDRVGLAALDVDHEADAARVVPERRVGQALLLHPRPPLCEQ